MHACRLVLNHSCCCPLPCLPSQGQDIASKQYLLLPLLTAGHGSLLVVCKPVKQQGRPADMYSPPQPSRSKRFESEALTEQLSSQEPLILHLDSGALGGCCPRNTVLRHCPTSCATSLRLWAHAPPDRHAACISPRADASSLLGPAGCNANCQHEPDCRSLVSFLRPYLAEVRQAMHPAFLACCSTRGRVQRYANAADCCLLNCLVCTMLVCQHCHQPRAGQGCGGKLG